MLEIKRRKLFLIIQISLMTEIMMVEDRLVKAAKSRHE
jgi:hypothetical protein